MPTDSKSLPARRDYRPARSVPATQHQFCDLLARITERLALSPYDVDRSLGHSLSETLRLYEPHIVRPDQEIIDAYELEELRQSRYPDDLD